MLSATIAALVALWRARATPAGSISCWPAGPTAMTRRVRVRYRDEASSRSAMAGPIAASGPRGHATAPTARPISAPAPTSSTRTTPMRQPAAGTADAGGADPAGLARARQSATSAAIVAESAFAAYLATRPRPAAVRETVSYLSAASRLWYAADILRTVTSGEPGPPRWDTLAPLARALEDMADRTAGRLRGQRAQPAPPGRPAPAG